MDSDFASPPPSWRREQHGPYLDSDEMYHDAECDGTDPKCPDPAHHTLMQLHKLVGEHDWDVSIGRGNVRTADGRTVKRRSYSICRVCGIEGKVELA